MTQDELRALGERWKACPGFRWRPGMTVRYTRQPRNYISDEPPFQEHDPAGFVLCAKDDLVRTTHQCGHPELFYPDLSCPATRGWLLDDVREAWGDPAAHVEPVGAVASGGAQWAVRIFSGECLYPFIQCQRVTEVEALVAALEAAPKDVA